MEIHVESSVPSYLMNYLWPSDSHCCCPDFQTCQHLGKSWVGGGGCSTKEFYFDATSTMTKTGDLGNVFALELGRGYFFLSPDPILVVSGVRSAVLDTSITNVFAFIPCQKISPPV